MTIFIYLCLGFLSGYLSLILSSLGYQLIFPLAIGFVVLFFTKHEALRYHLLFAFSAGLIVDVANQNRLPFEALFLLLIVFLTDYLRGKYIELSNRLIAFIYFIVVSIVYLLVSFAFYFHSISVTNLLKSVLGAIIIFVAMLLSRQVYRENL